MPYVGRRLPYTQCMGTGTYQKTVDIDIYKDAAIGNLTVIEPINMYGKRGFHIRVCAPSKTGAGIQIMTREIGVCRPLEVKDVTLFSNKNGGDMFTMEPMHYFQKMSVSSDKLYYLILEFMYKMYITFLDDGVLPISRGPFFAKWVKYIKRIKM